MSHNPCQIACYSLYEPIKQAIWDTLYRSLLHIFNSYIAFNFKALHYIHILCMYWTIVTFWPSNEVFHFIKSNNCPTSGMCSYHLSDIAFEITPVFLLHAFSKKKYQKYSLIYRVMIRNLCKIVQNIYFQYYCNRAYIMGNPVPIGQVRWGTLLLPFCRRV